MTQLAPAAEFSAEPDVMACTFGDGLALLDLRSGQYFALNAVGAFVWEQMAQPVGLAALCEAVTQRYDVTDERCRQDLHALLGGMEKANLIKAGSAPPA
jgi:hypothetical protein